MTNLLACSKRSDSEERRELVKASEKKGGDCIFLASLFSAPLPYSSRLSPLSECLEQTTNLHTSNFEASCHYFLLSGHQCYMHSFVRPSLYLVTASHNYDYKM